MDYKEFLEDYRETLSKYCYASADVPVRKHKTDSVFFIDSDLRKCVYIVGGNFDADYVAKELMAGDIDELLKDVGCEGWWHIEMLLKYNKGDYEEPSYMELLLTEASFMISFDDKEEFDKECFEKREIFDE